MKPHQIAALAKLKAKQSPCVYKVAALGFSKKGEYIANSFNKKRFVRKGGGIHCEMVLMKAHPKSIRTIIIARVGGSGDFRDIHPCSVCAAKAKELGIRIYTIKELIK
jgi:hypothetical protein